MKRLAAVAQTAILVDCPTVGEVPMNLLPLLMRQIDPDFLAVVNVYVIPALPQILDLGDLVDDRLALLLTISLKRILTSARLFDIYKRRARPKRIFFCASRDAQLFCAAPTLPLCRGQSSNRVRSDQAEESGTAGLSMWANASIVIGAIWTLIKPCLIRALTCFVSALRS